MNIKNGIVTLAKNMHNPKSGNISEILLNDLIDIF
jgi:hypothetical protein